MTKIKKACGPIIIVIVIAVLGFLASTTDIFDRKSTSIYTPPGLDERLDADWLKCKPNSAESQAACDTLWMASRENPEWKIYQDFASACGDKIEAEYPVDCTTQWDIRRITPVTVLPWGIEIKTICVSGNEVYDRVGDDFAPITTRIAHELQHHPFNLFLMEGDEGCDATLDIHATGRPLSELYGSKIQLFTGVVVNGRVTLSAPEHETKVFTFVVNNNPPKTYNYSLDSDNPTAPEDAPFYSSCKSYLEDMLKDWFGEDKYLK